MTVEFLHALEDAISHQKGASKLSPKNAAQVYLNLHYLLVKEAESRSWQDHYTLHKAPEYGLAPLVYDPFSPLPPVESAIKRLIPQGVIDEWRENPELIPGLVNNHRGNAAVRRSLVIIINALGRIA